MGMFDYVNVVIDCPSCGNELEGFQSKSGDCLLNVLQADDVDNFYTFCECGVEVVFNRPAKPTQRVNSPPDDLTKVLSLGFTMQTTTKEERKLKHKGFQEKIAAMKGKSGTIF